MRLRSGLAIVFFMGCSADLPAPPQGSEHDWGVRAESGGALGSLSAIARLRVSPAGAFDASAISLFEGELGDYHLRRVTRDDVPGTLEATRIPIIAWQDAGAAEIVVAPTVPLDPGPYTLAAAGHGLLAFVAVAESAGSFDVMKRLFPVPGLVSATPRWLYCGDAPLPRSLPERVLFDPGALPVAVLPGPLDSCVWLEAVAPLRSGWELLPPATFGEAFVDPSPIFVGGVAETVPLDCSSERVPFGTGCATVEDDRVTVQGGADSALWIVVGAPRAPVQVMVAHPDETLVLVGFEPASTAELDVVVHDRAGARRESRVTVHTASPRPHVVLNEVLANARGAEPAAEWIELVNDGRTTVDLEGFELADVGGRVVLPRALLGPGAFALLVDEDYAPDAELDVPPVEGTLLVRLPSLGKSGLSNSGERLELRAPDGRVVSRFASFPAKEPGVSIARRAPQSADTDRWTFGPHAAPGASPGAGNTVRDEPVGGSP